jgi:hypothetical protein
MGKSTQYYRVSLREILLAIVKRNIPVHAQLMVKGVDAS